MTLVAIPPLGLWDVMAGSGNNITSAGAIDAANEKYAVILQAPKAGTIDRVSFRTASVVSPETVDVRVETLAADGTPSGSLWAANTNVAQLVSTSNTWFEVTLAAGAVVAKGDWLAIVVALPGVTSGNMQIAQLNGTAWSNPYHLLFTGTWARAALPSVGAIRYSDGTYGAVPGLYPAITASNASFNSGTNPDERGSKITLPFACKVSGIWKASTTQEGDFTLTIYDSANNVLSDLAVDGNIHADGQLVLDTYHLDNELTFAAGDVVRVTLTATTATNTSLDDYTFRTGHTAAIPGGGRMAFTSRNDGGAWTDDPDRLVMLGLIVSALDDGAASASSPHAYSFVG